MNRFGIPIVVALVPFLAFGKNAATLPKSVDPGWWSKAQQEIAAGEYRIGFQEKTGLWQSPNRAQNLRVTYFDDGFSLKPRADSTETWNVEMRVLEVGKNAKPLVPQAHAPKALDKNGTRMTVSHPGFDIEYENGSEGMRQNFIVKQKPEGVGPLTVKMATSGLTALKKGPGDVVFSEKHPQNGDYRNKVWYKDLKAWDAEGKTLTAEMEVEEGELRLAVRDDGAVYPVTIDPLSTTANWTAESDQDSASLGYSLASAGDVNGDGYSDVIAGAYKYDNGNKDEGRAFVYLGGAGGLATTPTWNADCNQDSAYFGISVSTAGDVNNDGFSDVIVGALNYTGTVTAESYEGGAFIYLGGTGGLSLTPQRILESDQQSAWMGGSVASAGDVNNDGYSDVIVGTYGWTTPQVNEGRAQIFLGGTSGVAANAYWSVESNVASAEYGWSVASAGDINGDGFSDIIVGADGQGNNFQGRAYIYYGGSGAMAAGPTLNGSNQAGAYFGISVASAGDVNGDGFSDVVIGAFGAANGQSNEGRAFVYHGGSGGLGTAFQWSAESNQANAYFGYCVASAGDVNGDGFADVIVGAYSYDSTQIDGGMARIFPGGPTGLSTTPTWTATGGQAGATFGTAVASAGDVNGDGYSDVIVGADWYSNGNAREGRAFAYYGGPGGLSTALGWAMESNQADAYFGYSVSGAGDVNGDGFSDVIVGAYQFDNGENGEGRALVYHGSTSGLGTTPAWTGESNQASAQFGQSVSGAGDVNGDGFSDVIVGAPFYTHALSFEGRAYVYLGGSGGLSTSPAWTAQGGLASSTFAQSVSGAGDVNGDGFADVIVGQPNWTNGQTAEGRARVYLGRASGLDTTAAWTWERNVALANYGSSVSSAGDVNGDGFSDVIVGAPESSSGSGSAFVHLGGPGGVAASTAWQTAGPSVSSGYGSSVSSAGDVNGDGYSDVVVGAPTATQVRLYIGGPSGLVASPATTYSSGGGQFGVSVAGAGDVNGDGYSDFVVGETGNPNQWARVYYGVRTGGTALPSTAILYATNLGQFGFSVAGAGDVNGDGYSDIIVGAPDYYGGLNREGRATMYYGNGGAGLRATPGQFRAGSTIPIAPVGVANPTNQVYLGMWMRSPLGRQKGKVMYEYRFQGQAYTGIPVTNSVLSNGGLASFTDMGVGGVDMKLLVSGLSFNASYKWRNRVKYSPATAITGQMYGPWRYMPQDGKSEGGFRSSNRAGTLPSFTTQPINQSVTVPATATFAAAATGNPLPSYQWQRFTTSWNNIPGATVSMLTTSATVAGDNGAQFRCVATNPAGSVNSNTAVLTVQFAPVVTAGPNGVGVVAPAGASFAVTANGNPPVLSYQWRRGSGSPTVWADIPNANAASYSIPATTPSDNGALFSVAVWNTINANTPTISPTAALTVQYAPQITAQPANRSVSAGSIATFSVTANGNPSVLTYQWQKFVATAFAPISGAIAASYDIITVQTDSGSRFRVLITNSVGFTYSAEAVLSVSALLVRPNITADPVSDTAIAPQAAVFSATITGNPTPTLRWQRNGVDIPGATGNSYRLDTTRATDNGAVYRIIATNTPGIDTSANALLTVFYLPAINEHPRPITVTMPATATFTVTASAANPLPAYQWQRFNGAWANIPGAAATAASYTTPATVVGDNGAQFRCVVSNAAGSVTSNAAILTVQSLPYFTLQPLGRSVLTPASASFTATAGGNPVPSYQWQRYNGISFVNLPGDTLPSYTLAATAPADNGAQIRVVAINALGPTPSTTVILTVQYAPIINSGPNGITVNEGQNAVFLVSAAGNPGSLSYQWRRNGSDIAATGSSYTLLAAPYTENGAVYSVVVYNPIGSTLSGAALLTVNYRPRITSQPTSASVTSPAPVSFSMSANANPTPAYRWQRFNVSASTWDSIPGASFSGYTIDSTDSVDNGAQFRCVVFNSVGTDTSQTATLSVNAPLAAPVITSNPQVRTVIAPASVSFSATATGNPTPTFQWQRGGVDIPGATENTYPLASTAIADNGASFRVIASNSQLPPDTSAAAVLTVQYPPSISTQPAAVIAVPGTQASFTVTTTGNPTPTYQWQRYNTATSLWTNLPGAILAGYTTALVSAADNGAQFRCVATNVAGSATSNTAVLTVEFAPAITQQPINLTVTELGTAAFTAAASGSPSPSFQWQRYNTATSLWASIANETSVAYTLSPVQVTDNGAQFRILVSNSRGNTTSNPAVLTVQYAPRITTQPVGRTVSDGSAATFSVVAAGNPAPNYQWSRNGSIISGATQTSYTTPILTMADSGSVYSVSVQNGIGSPVVSNSVALTVTRNPPVITAQPADATVNEGQSASFTLAASGTSPLFYQWRRGTGSPVVWANIAAANGVGYTLSSATPADSGALYSCVVSNPAATVTSASALLRVNRVLIAPTINNTNLIVTGTISIAFTYAITASGTTPITYGASGLPAGLTVNTATGIISGTPTQTGTSPITLTAQNSAGQAPNKILSLTISALPVPPILNSPLTANGRVNQPFSYPITASGTQPITFGAANLPAGLALPDPQTGIVLGTPTLAGTFNVTLSASNQAGSASSQILVLTIDPAFAAPLLTMDLPPTLTVTEPQGVTFSVTATGVPTPTYQWLKNGATLPGANAPTYALTPTAISDSGARFQVNVTNSVGSVSSRVCTLTVNPAPMAPIINSQPASRTATVGQSVSFTVVASGTAPINYQWQYSLNGTSWAAAPGAVNSPSYTIGSARVADAGMYRVTVSNPGGSVNSAIAVLTVNRPRVDAPQANPPAGPFSTPTLNVALSVDSVGAVIRYTLNDADPNSSSPICSSTIQISSATTIMARGFRSDLDSSPVLIATYTPAGQAERPTAVPPDSTFTGSVIVSLTTSTGSASIRYTLDGSQPSVSSSLYTVPFTLSTTTTIQAFAVAAGLLPSDTLVKTYRLIQPLSQVAQPVATPPGRRFWNSLPVTLTTATDPAEIRYTLDGSNPTASSTLYNPAQSLMLSASATLKAVALRTGWLPSSILTESYAKAPGPLSSVPSRDTAFDNSLGVTLSLPGGQVHPIYYSLDGSVPIDGQFRKKSAALQYPGSAVTLSQSATMVAVAVDTLQNPPVPSDTVTRFYTKNSGQLPPPSASPAGKYFQDTVLVALRASDSTVTIRYTVNGNIPNLASLPYTQPLLFDNTTILQAIATKAGFIQSPVLFETYILSPDTPSATPRGGQYFDTVYVTLSTSSRRAALFYTLDGSNPLPSTATPYSGTPVRLTQNATLKAIAAAGNFSSPVRQETYNIAQRGDTILVPDGSYVPGGGYSFYSPVSNTLSARIVLAPPNNVTAPGIGAIPFAMLLSPAVENYPFPRIHFSKPSSDTRWLYRIGTDGRTYFVTNADTVTLIDSGSYFLGNDTVAPTVTMLGQSFGQFDSTVVSLRVDDNIAIIYYSLQRSDNIAFNIPQTTISTPCTLTVRLKNDPATLGNLGLSVNATDRKNSVRFPPGSGFRLVSQRITQAQSPSLYHIGELRSYPWDLVSFPVESDTQPTFGALRSQNNNMPDFAAVEFRSSNFSYVDQSPTSSFYAGKGYWVRSSSTFRSLRLPPVTLRAPTSAAGVDLDSGWNIIGNPRPGLLYWPHTRTDSVRYRQDSVKGLWAWDHATQNYVEAPDSLVPWRGYFVYNNYRRSARVTLSPTRVPAKAAGSVSFSGTMHRLALEYGRRKLELGLASFASAGLGVEDEFSLPALGLRRTFASLRQGRKLMADYLPLRRDTVSTWTIVMQNPDPLALAEPLRVAALSLPQDFEAWVVSPSRRLKYPLSGLPSFTPAPGTDTLLVVAGTSEALRKSGLLEGKTAALPGYGLRLLPVGRGFLLELDLPAQAKVEGRLVDLAGRTVGELSSRWLGAGHHVFSFQGHFRAKETPARGVYFLQLRYQGPGLPAQTAKQIHITD